MGPGVAVGNVSDSDWDAAIKNFSLKQLCAFLQGKVSLQQIQRAVAACADKRAARHETEPMAVEDLSPNARAALRLLVGSSDAGEASEPSEVIHP